MFRDASLLKKFCNECGNLTHYSVIKREGPKYTSTYIFIGTSLLIISILGLAKLYI